MTPGERIKLLRERRRMTGVQLAVRTGLNQSYLSKVERNKAGWSMEGLHAIASALGVTPGTLLDGVFEASGETDQSRYGMVPVYDFVQAGSPRGSSGTFDREDIESYVYCDLPAPHELFALIVRGSSMEPGFQDGDIVIFRRGREPRPGDFVAATNAALGGTFRRYRELGTTKDGDTIFALVPLNENYATYRSDEGDWKVIGTLVRHTRDYTR